MVNMRTKWTRAVNNIALTTCNSKPLLALFLGIGGEVDEDSQPEDAEVEHDQAGHETDSVTIEVPDHPGSPPQPAENTAPSLQGSRPSTADKQRQQEPSPANQLAVPWGQSGLMDIGIEEVSVSISQTHKEIITVTLFVYLILINIDLYDFISLFCPYLTMYIILCLFADF